MRQSGMRLAFGALLLMLSPAYAWAQDTGSSTPAPDISAVAAAEAEKPPLLPAPRAVDMPILVYHHIVPGHNGSGHLSLFVTPEGFEQQLRTLRDNGYQSISFDDLADCLEYGLPLPERPVIISLDDGWENQFQYGFPLLQKYGFSATFYVVSSYLGGQNFMTIEQLKTMIAAGMTIGDHTRTHPALPTIGNAQRLAEEIAGSKTWLEEHLHVPITTFAYPYGSYSAATVALVKAAGYRTARTVDSGTHYTAADLATLPAVVYPEFAGHYRDKLELAAHEPGTGLAPVTRR
jgi:peptidoglycan/xylan/chitin deacetylase (PgdA/CDA1 family)